MNKNDHPYISDSLMDHPIVVWMSRNLRMILQTGIVIIALLFVVYRFSSSNSAQAQSDYIKAANDYSQLANTKSTASALDQQKALDDLRDILNNHPDLAPKYDGWLAQTLLNQNKTDEALPFAKAALKRTEQNNLPLFTNFANTSLLISKGDYPQALIDSVNLKEQIINNMNADKTESLLLAFTQLRIAMLNNLSNNPTAERTSWNEFKQYATSGPYTDAFQSLSSSFTIGKISLSAYIDARLKALQQS